MERVGGREGGTPKGMGLARARTEAPGWKPGISVGSHISSRQVGYCLADPAELERWHRRQQENKSGALGGQEGTA